MTSCRVTLIALLLLGCSKIDVYQGDDSKSLHDALMALREGNATVDGFGQKGDRYSFRFSNDAVIGIEDSSVPIVTIGLQGYWVRNGESTEIPLDSGNEALLLRTEGEFLGVVEGFEDWSFLFDEGRITFEKSLFSTDPDAIVRGINHRGYCVEAPENTLPAFRLSKLKGFHYVEADVWFTSDDDPVLIHDGTVDRTSDGSGEVGKMRFEDLRQLDFGGWKAKEFEGTGIPSLEEFLALCRDIDLIPYIELKSGTERQVETAVTLVEEYGLKGKAVYLSFSSALLQYVSDIDPTASLGVLTGKPSETSIQTALGLMNGTNCVFIDSSDYSDTAVSLCKNASLPLEAWTVDSKSVILSLSPYISGVTSNRYHAGRVKGE